MRLTAFKTDSTAPPIRAAPAMRQWMDDTPDRFAYRCLPLTIANTHGWEVLCPSAIEIYWNGGPGLNDLVIRSADGAAERAPSFAISHFGSGIVTFHTGYLFQTEPGYSIHVSGPVNRPKDGAAALTGIVESDWLAQPFTMNWLLTAPGGPLIFEEGEPFCHIFPVARDLLQDVEPEIRELSSDPQLKQRYELWTSDRAAFNRELKQAGSAAQAEKWQKHYVRGHDPDGTGGVADHLTKLKVREFRNV